MSDPNDTIAAAVLDAVTLPPGMSSEQIPIPLDKDGKPIQYTSALAELITAGIRIDGRFDPVAREAAKAAKMDGFKAAAVVQGISNLIPSAIEAKERQIDEEDQRETREAQREYGTWRAIAGRLLHEARAEAITLRPHAASNWQDHQAANRDLAERREANEALERLTLPEITEMYDRTSDNEQRAFIRAIESGRRPTRSTPGDAAASAKLARLIRARQEARIPPGLRKAFAMFGELTNGMRATKDELLRTGTK